MRPKKVPHTSVWGTFCSRFYLKYSLAKLLCTGKEQICAGSRRDGEGMLTHGKPAQRRYPCKICLLRRVFSYAEPAEAFFFCREERRVNSEKLRYAAKRRHDGKRKRCWGNFVGRDAHIAPSYKALRSTVALHQRQRRKKKVDASYITISTMYCERAVYGIEFVKGTACRKSRNLGFWLSFWVLLGQRPKVPRPRRDEISPTPA